MAQHRSLIINSIFFFSELGSPGPSKTQDFSGPAVTGVRGPCTTFQKKKVEIVKQRYAIITLFFETTHKEKTVK